MYVCCSARVDKLLKSSTLVVEHVAAALPETGPVMVTPSAPATWAQHGLGLSAALCVCVCVCLSLALVVVTLQCQAAGGA